MYAPWRSSVGVGMWWRTSVANAGACWAPAHTTTTIWWSDSRESLSLRDVGPRVASFRRDWAISSAPMSVTRRFPALESSEQPLRRRSELVGSTDAAGTLAGSEAGQCRSAQGQRPSCQLVGLTPVMWVLQFAKNVRRNPQVLSTANSASVHLDAVHSLANHMVPSWVTVAAP
jgi:hypothetical protein